MMSINGWSTKTLMFADGKDGSALQMYVMCWDGQPTPIVMIWQRANRTDPGSRSYWFKDLDYSDFQKVEFDWVRAGRPMGDDQWPQEPQRLLSLASNRDKPRDA